MHLQSFELLFDIRATREHCRYGDQGPKLRRDTIGEFELREHRGWKQRRNHAMNESNRDIGRRNGAE